MGYTPESPQQRGGEFDDTSSRITVHRCVRVRFLSAARTLYASIPLLHALQSWPARWWNLSAHECKNLAIYETLSNLKHAQLENLNVQLIPKLGPLDWFFNTPSNHRVHHARNRYCIDRNYGGKFFIWDHLFGTYEPERDDEELHYGLVHPLKSFDPWEVEVSVSECAFYL